MSTPVPLVPPAVTFIYTPRSHDRVFAESARAGIAVVRWANRSRHVVGGVLLYYPAACPGAWWRTRARDTATAIVRAVGGVAWDENGAIRLIVPVGCAGFADRLMRAARGGALRTSAKSYGDDAVYGSDDAHNEAAVLVEGSGTVRVDTGRVVAACTPLPETPNIAEAVISSAARARMGEEPTERRIVHVGAAWIHAPLSWGIPEVAGVDAVSCAPEEEEEPAPIDPDLADAIADAHRREDREAAEWAWIPF